MYTVILSLGEVGQQLDQIFLKNKLFENFGLQICLPSIQKPFPILNSFNSPSIWMPSLLCIVVQFLFSSYPASVSVSISPNFLMLRSSSISPFGGLMHNFQHGYIFLFSSFVILPSCCKQSISSHFAFIDFCAHCSSAFCILCLLHPCEHLLCYPFAHNLPQSVLTIKEVSLLYFHFLCRYFAKKHFCYSQSFFHLISY